jgi:glycerophosphoryl diester phosphodiesterase
MGRAFLDAPVPIAIAHRGGAEDAPENTLPAFAAAVELGYTYVETDVHLTRDGVLVAFHDARLDRVTDRRGAIAEMGLDEILAADAGFHFTPDSGRTHPYRGQAVTVPTLEEILTRWPDVRVNIDTKSDATVAPLVELIARLEAWDRVCVGSFSSARLRQVRRLSDDRLCTSMGPRAVALARLTSLGGRITTRTADCIQVPVAAAGVRIVDPIFLRAARRSGLRVHVWTVSVESEMERLVGLGVDGIMTDRPGLLRQVLERRGLWHARAPEATAETS